MLLADGSLEPVRCGAPNRCSYCAMFAAFEAALVIKLDAQIRQPTAGITTTTRAPDFGFARLRKAEQALWRQLRRDLTPLDIQYVGFLEWTTGKGTRSGGHRRPHLHHLVKGIPADHELLQPIEIEGPRGERVTTTGLERHVGGLWHRFTGDAWVAEARSLRTPAGAIAYLTLHHHKREQGPPPGFTGRRLRPSKGYYEIPIVDLRELARQLTSSVRVRAAVRRVVAVELYGEERPEHYELDCDLTEAIVDALREFRPHKATVQLDLDGNADVEAADKERARQELVERTLAELERIRTERPPELVYVREREVIDPETGGASLVAVAVLGPVESRKRAKVERGKRNVDAVQLRIDRPAA